MELTFSQCKQMVDNGTDLRDFIDDMNSQPDWLDSMGGIDSVAEIQAIQQGGCASGAFMPAVTYRIALNVMNEYGDSVTDYIVDDHGLELPIMSGDDSWGGFAVKIVSTAVELWVSQYELDGVDWD